MKKLFASFLLSAFLMLPAAAGVITLAWDPSPTTGVTYRVYGKPLLPLNDSNLHTAEIKTYAGTRTRMRITTARNGIYYFVVVAEQNSLRSVPSNMISVRIQPVLLPPSP